MKVTLPLTEMTTAEKLIAIEELWADLQRSPEDIPVPPWHADVLAAREERVRRGESKFSEWSDAKVRIRDDA